MVKLRYFNGAAMLQIFCLIKWIGFSMNSIIILVVESLQFPTFRIVLFLFLLVAVFLTKH